MMKKEQTSNNNRFKVQVYVNDIGWLTFGQAKNVDYHSAIAFQTECERHGDKARIVPND